MKLILVISTALLFWGCATKNIEGINNPHCTIAPPSKNTNKSTIGTNFGKKN